MAFTLIDLTEIIDDCIEEGKQIGIACNKHIARIIEQYLDEYDMPESFNILNKTSIPFDNIKSDCLVVINVKDDDYEYYIDYYELNEKLPMMFDEFVWIGYDIEDIDYSKVMSRTYRSVNHIEINDEDIADIFADEFNYEDEEIDNDYVCDCDECQKQHTSKNEEFECPECCVECDNEDCEFNGIVDDCGGDKCVRVMENEYNESECDCEECIGKKTVTEEEFVILVTEAILSRNGCFDCTLEIVENLVSMMKDKGWEAHKNYIRECNEGL